MSTERVVIVGASPKPDRYAHKAQLLLHGRGHQVVPVNPTLSVAEIEGIPVVHDLSEVTGPVDTVTMYVGEKTSAGLKDKLIALKPKRVIFNPGAENALLALELEKAGIKCEDACTLVMLSTGQF
ncbi:MAG TPA: CoA-binding protein [Prosthecobacter sp.]